MKFKFLKIDLSSNNTYNCHAAAPHKIDFVWLKENTGNLFNTEVNVRERQMMLRNERNSSCEQNCWAAEDRGATSPRLYQHGVEQTHTTVITTPESVDLTINNDCNLTCSYCCKEFSSSWRRDIVNNGDYRINNTTDLRYTISTQDRILNKISQNELHNSSKYKLLIDEIQSYSSTLKLLDVTGGEPLLDNHLVEILTSLNLNSECKIILYTGAGVSLSRFEKIMSQLSTLKNLQVKLSAENTGSFLEFNRYGIKWEEFQKKIQVLDKYVDWKFHSTLSNLTIFGFADFVNYFKNRSIEISFAYQPKFMSPFVLDPASKQQITNQIESLDLPGKERIITSIQSTPTSHEKQGIKDFLVEFTKRRQDLSIDIFPKSFLQWLELDHHVVQ